MAVVAKQGRLREIREDQLKTQQQVALDSGIALFTYQRAERGDEISTMTLRKIARALSVGLAEVLETPGKVIART